MCIARFFAVLAVSAGALSLSATGVAQSLLHGAGSTMSANYVEASLSAYQAAHGVSPIIVVHRADTSGTSFIFTSFLSGASETWADRFGLGSRLSWPTGQAAEGSAGVRDAVRGQPGAIGYLEYGNALKEGLATAQLASGKDDFVRASPESFRLALTARPAERASHYQLLTRSPIPGAWPILATEYGLIELKERTQPKYDAVARFLQFLATGPTLADFQFVPYGARSAGDHVE
jgi:phosphate transport system substrate-binding protein